MEILLPLIALGGVIIAMLLCGALGVILRIIELAVMLADWLIRKGDDIFRCWRNHRRKV